MKFARCRPHDAAGAAINRRPEALAPGRLFYEDRMTNAANAPAATPAGGEGTPGEEAERDDYVTLAGEDSESDDDSDDAGEPGDDGDGRDPEAGDDDGAEDAKSKEPKRRSGSQRAKARIQALQREIEDLRRGQARHAPATMGDDDLPEPREADFPNDYLAYDRALRDYQTRKAIRDEKRRDAAAHAVAHAEAEARTRLAGFMVRLETVKDRIPDFDRVLASAAGVHIRNDLRDLILDSPKGPLLAYHLAKNPDRLAELNRMSPAAAAKDIGSLEARIRGPNPRTVTKAKTPAQTPRGGTAARAPDPAAMSMEQYIAARKAGTI
jgi:hypothetical protein